MTTVYRVYMLIENPNVAGKYITNIYNADDVITNDLTLPSGSTSYTLPNSNGTDEKEAYLIRDVIVIGDTTPIKYLEIWLNDKDSSDVVVLAVNTGATVNRQFEKMEYIIGEGTPIKLKQK